MNEARRVRVDGREAGFAEVVRPGGKSVQDDAMIALAAQLMDSMFHLPGTRIRFGLDPLVGLIPGVGDGAGTLVSVAIIGMSARYRVPKIVLARMALNAAINGVIGTVPVAGDVFSVWFKSNQMNYDLLRKHAGRAGGSTRGDWLFVGGLIAAVVLLVGLAFAWTIAFWIAFFRWVF